MAFDGLFLHCIKEELETGILDSRVEKVYQPSREEILLQMRGRGGARKLLLSAKADAPRIHFTQYAPENPAKPPMLCMLLRKYLTGARLTALRQTGLERILFLDFEATNELGDKIRLTLCIEIMARHSNIILMDESSRIIDAVKRVDFTKSSVREILPGLTYVLPPQQEKVNLLETPATDVTEAVNAFPQKNLSKALQSVLQGISPLVCRELAHRAGGDLPVESVTPAMRDSLVRELENIKQMAEQGTSVPTLLLEENRPKEYTFLPITQYGELMETRTAHSFSELLDSFYYERERADRIRHRSSDLFKHLNVLLDRTVRKVAVQKGELEACADREKYRIYGDLIHGNLHRLEKGAAFYTVDDFYEETLPQINIPADPSLTPAQNAQKYYKEYRKLQTAEVRLEELIESGVQEIAYLESVLDELGRAGTEGELAEIREELIKQGYLRKKGKGKQKAPRALPPMQFFSSEGIPIYVGRNNTQNDRLTLKEARKGDLWFHTKEIPSAHVILAAQGRAVSDQSLQEAALLAAYHSKARESSSVPVDFTLVKQVHKPQGAKPGKVIYEQYKTLVVTPSLEKLEAIKSNSEIKER